VSNLWQNLFSERSPDHSEISENLGKSPQIRPCLAKISVLPISDQKASFSSEKRVREIHKLDFPWEKFRDRHFFSRSFSPSKIMTDSSFFSRSESTNLSKGTTLVQLLGSG
jgi:hypothetical protein